MRVLTYKFRLKNAKTLVDKARAVNFVWNYCGEVQNIARRHRKRWPTYYTFCNLIAGAASELGLNSHSVRGVADAFVIARDKAKRRPKWRASQGSKRALGWIPFDDHTSVVIVGRSVRYLGVTYPIWMHRKVEGHILCGSFNEDARGRWFINLTCKIVETPTDHGNEEIGIDLGLKDFATLSTGEKIANPLHFAREEQALAIAQRAGNKKRVRAIHAKIRNRRAHDHHVNSYRLMKRAKLIVVGNVSSAKLAQTMMAKSVYDAGWYQFKQQLRYKAIRHGVVFKEVNEAYSTQDCSSCGARCGPRGLEGLGVRTWQCLACDMQHDRDVNAAKNILRTGQKVDLQLTESTTER